MPARLRSAQPSPEDRTQPEEPLLRIEGLTKTFPGCVALDSLRLEVRAGEVLALVGQNGCGKSTFIKILSGFHQPDPGFEATFDGAPLRLGDPEAPHAHGIHFVHQDLGLLGDLSAVENLAIGPGYCTNRFGLVRWQRAAPPDAGGARRGSATTSTSRHPRRASRPRSASALRSRAP